MAGTFKDMLQNPFDFAARTMRCAWLRRCARLDRHTFCRRSLECPLCEHSETSNDSRTEQNAQPDGHLPLIGKRRSRQHTGLFHVGTHKIDSAIETIRWGECLD